MKRKVKKIVSFLLTLAMIVTSLNYTPKAAQADVDASDYVKLTLTGYDDLWYAVDGNSFTGFGAWYGDSGITLQFSYTSDAGSVTVTIDGAEATVGSTITLIADGLVKINPNNLPSTGTTTLVLYSANLEASMTIIVTKEDPSDSTGSEETSTTVETGETTTEDTSASADTAPDLTTVIANTPDVDSDDGWTAASGSNGCSFELNNKEYYVATSYFFNGTYNTFFTQDYGFWGACASGQTPTYAGGTDNPLTGEVLVVSSNNITGGVTSVWVGETKLTDGTDYYQSTTNSDVLSISTDCFDTVAGTSQAFYITVVTSTDTYSFPIKIVTYTERVSNLYVNDYSSHTGKYIVKFDEITDDGIENYRVYIDDTATDIYLGGSGDYITYSELSSYDIGDHELSVTAVYSSTTDNGDGTYTTETTEGTLSSSVTVNVPDLSEVGDDNDIAQVYIQTDDTTIDALTGMTKTKVTAAITVIDQEGVYEDIYDDATKTTIKVRGNSTAYADKKAFNIAFSSKENVFGLGGESGKGAKKWSLLANAFDKTLIRNKLAMGLGDELGIQYNSQSRYVDLYLNGTYMGNYLLIESVEAGSDRVNIDSDDAESDDILLELDNNGRDESTDAHLIDEDGNVVKTSIYGEEFTVNEPGADPSEEDEYTEWKETYATKIANTITFLNNFETALQGGDYDDFSQYMDVDSFVSYYLANEIFKNQDINFSSTRFYIKDGVLYAGPMWDLDLSSGNVSVSYYGEDERSAEGYKATDMAWFEALMDNDTFKALVVEKFNEVAKPYVESMYADSGVIDTLIDSISGSITRNYTSTDEGGAGWSISTKDSGDGYSYANTVSWSTYDESIEYLKDWLEERITWLDKQWNDTVPDLTEAKANTPDTSDLTGWVQSTNLGGSTSGTLGEYYIAANYYYDSTGAAGTYNTGYFANNTSFWGIFDSDDTVPYGGNSTLTGEKLAWASDINRAGNDSGGLQSVWLDGEKLTSGTDYFWSDTNDDVLSINTDIFDLDGAESKVFYITVRTETEDYTFPIMIVSDGEEETSTEADTTTNGETTTAAGEDDDYDWVQLTEGSDIYYYVAEDSTGSGFNYAKMDDASGSVYIAYNIGAKFTSVTLDGVAQTVPDGAFFYLDTDDIPASGYCILTVVAANGTDTVTLYFKSGTTSTTTDYAISGLVAYTVENMLNISWTASDDAISAGAAYTVEVSDGETSYTIVSDTSTTTATYDFGENPGNLSLAEGTEYTVTVSTYISGTEEAVDEQSTTVNDESGLVWYTDEYLTASQGEGAKYASTTGTLSLTYGSITFQESQIWILTGAQGSSITISVNDETVFSNTSNSAAGTAVLYSALSIGMNTIVIAEDGSTVTTIYIYVPEQAKNLYVNDYSSYTGKYIVKFDQLDDAVSYRIYIDGTATDIYLGGSGDYVTCDELSSAGYATGDHKLSVTAVYSDDTESVESASVAITIPETAGDDNDIAQIYVQTDDTTIDALTGMTKTKVMASITVVDQEGVYEDIYDDATKTTIKVRGNSTAGAEKKAFNIAFSSKENVFGLGGESGKGAKKWSLLANAFDKTLIRNKLAMSLGDELGIQYNSQSRYVDLYLNGRYMGNYLLIESVEAGSDRVNIDSDNADSNDILLELDNNGRDVDTDAHLSARTDIYNEYFTVNEPGADPSDDKEYTEWQTTYATKVSNALEFLNQFETALQGGDFDEICQYIDVDSFVSYYLANEIFKNQDINFSSTRFYIKDGVLYAGPMWDLDLSSGNLWTTDNGGNEYSEEDRSPEGYKATTMAWFEALMDTEEFKALVVEKFNEVAKPYVESMYADDGIIDTLIDSISGSITRNYTSTDEGGAGWSVTTADTGDTYSYAQNPGWDSYDDSIDYLKEWLRERIAWLSLEWNEATLTNDNGNITVSWQSSTEDISYFTISYIDYETGETVTVQTDGYEESCSLGQVLIENNTTVTVTVVYNDGESSVYAEGTAQADLLISEISADSTVYEGTAFSVTGVIKNVGTAVAAPDRDDALVLLIRNAGGTTLGYNISHTDVVINPNGTYQIEVENITISTQGTYTLTGVADERSIYTESDEDNNTTDFTVEVNSASWQNLSGECDMSVNAGDSNTVEVTGTVSFKNDTSSGYVYTITGYDGTYMTIEGDSAWYNQGTTVMQISEGVSSSEALTSGELTYSDIEIIEEYSDSAVTINSANALKVTYQYTYYNLKITNDNESSVLQIMVEVEPGETAVDAFQTNTNTSEGGVSEFNPSFRIVNDASKIVATSDDSNPTIGSIVKYGTLYTVNTGATKSDMTFEGDDYTGTGEINDGSGVYAFEATSAGTLSNWSNATDENSYYYALTIKSLNYDVNMLDTTYTFLAYAVAEDGTIVYADDVESTTLYDIAKVLYDNSLMTTEEAHNYLYDNVLNIVAIKNSRSKIANAMLYVLGIRSKDDENYAYVNNAYKDLLYYINMSGPYAGNYYERGAFVCKTETNGEDTEEVLLGLLNTASTSEYTSVADWCYDNVDTYPSGYGFYTKTTYNHTSTTVTAEADEQI